MERLEVSTGVFVPPSRVYDFLVDFPGYADYSEYLDRVERRGDGSAGTRYDITVSWWRLSRTVTSYVTGVEPPERIDWQVESPITAAGAWLIEATGPEDLETPVDPPDEIDRGARVALVIRYDPSSLDGGRLDVPAVVSVEGLVDRLAPIVEREATRTVERIVADLEGRHREVRLDVARNAPEQTEKRR